MAWKPKRQARLDWRSYLTAEEAAIVARYDAAEAARAELAKDMQMIRNRAIQRVRYDERGRGKKRKD